MQINRLIEIAFILLKKEKVSAKELAEKFEVSTRTIYRDVETLCYAGIPIITDKGNGGGICIEEGFRIKNSFFTEQEQNELLILLKSQLITKNQASENILNKLSAAFNKNPEDYIEIDFTSWQNREGETDKLNNLKTAITERRKIEVKYYSIDNGYSIKNVEPLKLVFKNISWYLYAYSQKDSAYRLYKLNRMQNLKLTNEHFVRSKDIQNIAQKTEWIEDLTDCEIEFDKSIAASVYDFFTPNQITHLENKIFVKAKLPLTPFLAAFFLSFGDKVKVLKPQEFVENIKDIAKKVLDIYK